MNVFTEFDTITRDMAHGRAAVEELKHLKTLIEYWLTVDPSSQEITVKISRQAQVSAENFRDMVFNYATYAREEKLSSETK